MASSLSVPSVVEDVDDVTSEAEGPLDATTTPVERARIYLHRGEARSARSGDRDLNLRAAIDCYEAALRAFEPGAEPMLHAEIQHRLGASLAELSTGDRGDTLMRAIACFEEALRFRTKEAAPSAHAATLSNLGIALMTLPTRDRAENVSQAITCFRRALEIFTLESNPRGHAMVQTNLGQAYRALPTRGRDENVLLAITCFEAAGAACGPEVAAHQYASNQHSLGNAYSDLRTGDPAENLARALACYEEALRYWTEERAPRDHALAQCSLANALLSVPTDRAANRARAIACYEVALRYLTFEATPHDYALTQNALGDAHRTDPSADREANQRKAIVCFEEALRVWTKEAAPFEHAGVVGNLGIVYKNLPDGHPRDLTRAVECYEEALSFFTAESAPFHHARLCHSLAAAHEELAEHAERHRALAVSCYNEALAFWTLDSAPFERRMCSRQLARLHFEAEEWRPALDAYRLALDADERLYRAGVSTAGRSSSMIAGAALYQMAAFAAARVVDATTALLLLERGKTRLLAEALHLRIARPDGVPDEAWATFERTGADLRLIAAHPPASSGAYGTRERAVRDAATALDSAITTIRRHVPGFLAPMDASVLASLAGARRTAMIAFAVTDRASLGLVVGPDGVVTSVEVPGFNEAALAALLARRDPKVAAGGGWLADYRRYRDSPDSTTKAAWTTTLTRVLEIVGERLLAPILRAVPPGVERIVFLPSGALFLLPLHAAPTSPGAVERICDLYEIAYAPSLEVLVDCTAKATQMVTSRLFAAADPGAHPRLLFAPVEARLAASFFAESDVALGAAATKAAVAAGARGCGYVHFTCHATYDWEDPAASGLELVDGPIQLRDLEAGALEMKNTRLVVLSACETGIIDLVKNAPGEYVGLPAAFLSAGAACVVSSLWAVPDLSTSLLMEAFYENLRCRGKDPSAALHAAQRRLRDLVHGDVVDHIDRCLATSTGQTERGALLDSKRIHARQARREPEARPFEHPYFWAPFQVVGA